MIAYSTQHWNIQLYSYISVESQTNFETNILFEISECHHGGGFDGRDRRNCPRFPPLIRPWARILNFEVIYTQMPFNKICHSPDPVQSKCSPMVISDIYLCFTSHRRKWDTLHLRHIGDNCWIFMLGLVWWLRSQTWAWRKFWLSCSCIMRTAE